MTTTVSAPTLRIECLERRRARVREGMRAAGLELLVAYGSGLHSFLEMNAAWYLSGFKQIGPHAAVLLPLDGEPVLIVTPTWDEARAREKSTIPEIIATNDFLGTLDQELRRRAWRGLRAGFTGDRVMPVALAERLPNVVDQPPADADKVVSDVAKIRDEWSLDCVMRAVDIAEKAYEHLLEVARPGLPEHELTGEIEAFQRGLGADDCFQLMCASQHNTAVHSPSDRILAVGDVILGEITPAVEGEFLQICRTAVLGSPNESQAENFAILDAGLRAGMQAARPGARVGDVVDVINQPLVEAGYGEYARPPYMRTRGHSMSLGAMEPRDLPPNSPFILEKGMVFVMHPNQYLPNTGYFMCGEPVIVEDNGARPLTHRMGTLDGIAVR